MHLSEGPRETPANQQAGEESDSGVAVPLPTNEPERLAALHRFELIDTPPEREFDQIAHLASKLLHAPVALITLLDKDRQWFKSRIGMAVRETPREHAFCAHAILEDDLLVIADATLDPRFRSNPLVIGAPGIRFYAGAPLRTADGQALGTLCVIDTKPRLPLSNDEAQVLRDLAAVVMSQIEARQAAGYLQPVTGLPNSVRLVKDLDAFITDETRGDLHVAIAVIKMASPGQYAELIQTLGHAVADEFELAAAERIIAALPAKAKLYHLTGARFAYVLQVADEAEIGAAMNLLADALIVPVQCQGIPLRTAKGIGIALYPYDGPDGTELLRVATSAAHESLEEEKIVCRYSRSRDQGRQRAFRLLRDLATAVTAEDEFSIVYQPKTDMRTQKCIGAEALVRWLHPELGAISPSEFIPLAEQTTLVRAVTDRVLRSALSQTARWRQTGRNLRTSINISMLDLDDYQFANRLAGLLDQYNIKPDWIDVEVTESALMRDREQVVRQLSDIRQFGVEIGIDDFGTGQSALSYLKDIPASYLKIDQVFIRNLDCNENDQKMVRSTIALAHDLGLGVVAEGVETIEIYDRLRDQGCDVGQGHFISRPLSAAAFEVWLDSGSYMGVMQMI